MKQVDVLNSMLEELKLEREDIFFKIEQAEEYNLTRAELNARRDILNDRIALLERFYILLNFWSR